jgi:hypothetical protein
MDNLNERGYQFLERHAPTNQWNRLCAERIREKIAHSLRDQVSIQSKRGDPDGLVLMAGVTKQRLPAGKTLPQLAVGGRKGTKIGKRSPAGPALLHGKVARVPNLQQRAPHQPAKQRAEKKPMKKRKISEFQKSARAGPADAYVESIRQATPNKKQKKSSKIRPTSTKHSSASDESDHSPILERHLTTRHLCDKVVVQRSHDIRDPTYIEVLQCGFGALTAGAGERSLDRFQQQGYLRMLPAYPVAAAAGSHLGSSSYLDAWATETDGTYQRPSRQQQQHAAIREEAIVAAAALLIAEQQYQCQAEMRMRSGGMQNF